MVPTSNVNRIRKVHMVIHVVWSGSVGKYYFNKHSNKNDNFPELFIGSNENSHNSHMILNV